MCLNRVCLVASRNLLDLEHSQKVPAQLCLSYSDFPLTAGCVQSVWLCTLAAGRA